METITNPEQLLNVISKSATIRNLGKDVKILNFKESLSGIMKKPANWHFQISKCKRIFVKLNGSRSNVLVRGEYFYKNDLGKYQSLFLRNKNSADILPLTVTESNNIASKKKQSVKKLLDTHYGSNWEEIEELDFFKCVLEGNDEPLEANEICEPIEEDPDLKI